MSADPYDLARFVAAQAGGVFETAVDELRRGRKTTHWMWFVFPQLTGLGHSSTAHFYGIGSLDEARAYLAHPVLGARLQQCANVLELLDARLTAHAVFGTPDDLKLCSSLTLFAHAAGPGSIYARLLDRYCAGRPDRRTLALLELQPPD
ncbi:MAG TPA: DUF1810 domain-containing protein [Steroidobacteraceae bacterium]|nr:DUF1810 domain-containing protein [Steroidobacteraceae bacterium]